MTASVLYDAPGPKAKRVSFFVSIIVGSLLFVGLGWLVITLGSPRTVAGGTTLTGVWDPARWDIFAKPIVWKSLLVDGLIFGTLRVAGLAACLAIVLGVLLAFGRMSPKAYIRVPVTIVLEFFRGMPVLLMMLFILLALATDGFWAAVGALAVYNGAILGEAFRAGIMSLPRGQREAGLSLGLTPLRTRMLIEFPQAFRQMLPIVVAQLVVLLKDTSLAYVVAYPELLRKSNELKDYFGSAKYAFSIFVVALGIYLTVNLLLSYFARWIAHRTGPRAVGAHRRRSKRKGPSPTPPRGEIGTDTSLVSIEMASGMTGRASASKAGGTSTTDR